MKKTRKGAGGKWIVEPSPTKLIACEENPTILINLLTLAQAHGSHSAFSHSVKEANKYGEEVNETGYRPFKLESNTGN